ncbi:MAG TPA: DUF222 domain-containing protein [Actinomycetota bacterium]
MFAPTETIAHAIDAARDAASSAEIAERPEVLAALLRGADALLAAAAQVMSGGVLAVAGRPVEHVLRHDARVTSWDATTLTRAAATLEAMPALAEAFREGRASWSQVRAIVTALRPVPFAERTRIDGIIGEHAKRLCEADPERLVDLVQDEAARSRPDLALNREDRAIRNSFLAIQGRLDGTATIYGEGDALSIAAIVDALDAVADAPVHPDSGVSRAQQRYDALVHICEVTLAGESAGAGARPRPRLLATVDIAALEDDGRDDGLRLLWPLPGRRPRLSRVTRDMLMCDATIVPIVFNGRDVIAVGDQANMFSDKVRSAIIARDQQCRFCSWAPASWCDVHHLVPGKGNTVRDGCLLCRRCHRTIHRYKWTAHWLDDGALKFERRGKHFLSLPP